VKTRSLHDLPIKSYFLSLYVGMGTATKNIVNNACYSYYQIQRQTVYCVGML